MGKIYFGLYLVLIRIKSFFSKIKFRMFGASIGKNVVIHKVSICGYPNKINIENNCTLHDGTKIIINKEGNLKIKDNTLLSYNVILVPGKGSISIGENTMIAANTYIVNNDHSVDENLSVRNSGHVIKNIHIGDNVWVGANCSILKGVIIGEGSVIGAGSIVTKTIPPYSIAFGNPCKVIKPRYKKSILLKKLIEEGYSKDKIDSIFNEMKSLNDFKNDF